MDGSVKKIMSAHPVSARPETPLVDAANVMITHDFRGLPVVDYENRVVGVLTEYDLIIKGSSLHLPTFIKIMKEIDLYRNDAAPINDDLKKIINMKVAEAMNTDPFKVEDTASIEDVAKVFSEHHKINPLIVVDKNNALVGVVTRRDLVRAFGHYSAQFKDKVGTRKIDANVNRFVRAFEKRFVMVSRFRTHTWLLFSAMFFLIGFLAAFAFIIRINK